MKGHKNFAILLAAALFLAAALEAQEERRLRGSFLGETRGAKELLRTGERLEIKGEEGADEGGQPPPETPGGGGLDQTLEFLPSERGKLPEGDFKPIAPGTEETEMFIGGTGAKKKYIWHDFESLGPYGLTQPSEKPFLITPNAESEQKQPAVAFDGENYLVVWVERPAASATTLLRGARVTPQGKVLDPAGFTIGTEYMHAHPRIAFGKNPKTGQGRYLVVWERNESGYKHKVYGAIVTMAGKVLMSGQGGIIKVKEGGKEKIYIKPIPIFIEESDALQYGPQYREPDVAFNGQDFVVVGSAEGEIKSSKKGSKELPPQGIVARLVKPDGWLRIVTPKQTSKSWQFGKPITIQIDKPGVVKPANWPRIASNGAGACIVTWAKFTNSYSPCQLWGVKLAFSLSSSFYVMGAPKRISDHVYESGYGDVASAAVSAGGYAAAWQDVSRVRKLAGSHPPFHYSDLFKASLLWPKGKPLEITAKNWGPLYLGKANPYVEFHPSMARDEFNYVALWNDVEPSTGPKPIVPGPGGGGGAPPIPNRVKGSYLRHDGTPLEAFLIRPEDGGRARDARVCMGGKQGLLVYTYTKPLVLNTLIRARFVSSSMPLLFQDTVAVPPEPDTVP